MAGRYGRFTRSRRPIEITIQLENADELPLSADAVSVAVAGRWSLGLGITISATDTVNVVSPILIR